MPRSRAEAEERARALAGALVAALESEGRVARFVDSYAARYDRASLRAHPLQYREMIATISREALLAMVARLEAEFPHRFGWGKRSVFAGLAVQALEAFRAEFFAALADALGWTLAEREAFRRDLEIYSQLAAREDRSAKSRRPGEAIGGAFVDRCALLLDPSMLDKARDAAAQFLLELDSLAAQVLRRAFRTRRQP